MLQKFRALDIIYSGKCNMACTYCFIHKNKTSMENYNSLIREALISGDFCKKIIEAFPDNKETFEVLSLWGAEPTINHDLFENFITPLLDYYTNVERIMFSTNALLGLPAIKDFIDTLNKYTCMNKRKIMLEIQLSLDGPDYINDSSRHPGATKNTIKVAKEIISYVNEIDNQYFKLGIHNKATISPYWFEYLVQDINRIYEYYTFFDELQEECLSLVKNKNIESFMALNPTIVNPGEFTEKDGCIFAKWINMISTLDTSRFKHVKHPLYGHGEEVYKFFMETCDTEPYIPFKRSCSAGLNSLSIDYKGDILTCHRIYDNIFMGTSITDLQFSDDNTISKERKYKDIEKVVYLNDMYHSSMKARFNMFKVLINGLIWLGKIPPIEKYPLRWLFHLVNGVNCHIGQGEMTGSFYLTTLSYINLFAYGAAEEMYKYYKNLGGLNGN